MSRKEPAQAAGEVGWKQRNRKTLLPTLTKILLLALLLSAFSSFPSQKRDYLTDEEIEQLREAQEPAERIKLLDDFLKGRLEKARALKSTDPLKEKENKPNPENKSKLSHSKKPGSPDSSSKTSDK